MDVLLWLQDWYRNQCDGNWEHDNGISIDTVDNPGWIIKIDLNNTQLEQIEIERVSQDGDNNWFDYRIENSTFIGVGDPSKLIFLLSAFKNIVELYE